MRALLHGHTYLGRRAVAAVELRHIRFKDIREIHPNTPDSAIAYSLPFVKRSGLFIWELEIVAKPRLKALVVVCDAADADSEPDATVPCCRMGTVQARLRGSGLPPPSPPPPRSCQ